MPAPMQLEHEEYLGDGLYAGFDGYHVILWTEREFRETHYVALEPSVVGSFQRYIKQLSEMLSRTA